MPGALSPALPAAVAVHVRPVYVLPIVSVAKVDGTPFVWTNVSNAARPARAVEEEATIPVLAIVVVLLQVVVTARISAHSLADVAPTIKRSAAEAGAADKTAARTTVEEWRLVDASAIRSSAISAVSPIHFAAQITHNIVVEEEEAVASTPVSETVVAPLPAAVIVTTPAQASGIAAATTKPFAAVEEEAEATAQPDILKIVTAAVPSPPGSPTAFAIRLSTAKNSTGTKAIAPLRENAPLLTWSTAMGDAPQPVG